MTFAHKQHQLGQHLDRLRELDGRMQTIIDAAGDGAPSAEQRVEFDGLESEYDAEQSAKAKLWASFSKQERFAMMENETRGRQTEPDSITDPGMRLTTSSPSGRRAIQFAGGQPSKLGRTMAELFPQRNQNVSELNATGGFGSFNAFIEAIQRGQHDDRLKSAATLAQSEGVPSEGGFLVPEEFSTELLDTSLESEIVRPRADVRPMSSNTKKVAGVHHADASGGSIYGFTAKWKKEVGSGDIETVKTGLIELTARKLFIMSKSSNELLEDGENFEFQLTFGMAAAAGWHMDDAFLNGSGSGQPLGVINDPALVTVAKQSGQAAATITHKNLVQMFARIHPASLGNSIWVINNTAIPQLLELTISIGTGGSHIPVMSETTTGQFTILTRPVIFTEKLPTLGTAGDILLVDFSQYIIGMRREVVMDKSMHIGFADDETHFRTIVRVDGQGKWSAPYTPANGDDMSWCVALATRA